MTYFQLMLQSLAIELACTAAFFHRSETRRVIEAGILGNALTHPWVVFGFLAVPHTPLLPLLWLAEAFAVFTEAAIYAKLLNRSYRFALFGSAFANFLSWELGPRLSFWMNKHGWIF